MAEIIVSKVQRGAKLESRGAKHPLIGSPSDPPMHGYESCDSCGSLV